MSDESLAVADQPGSTPSTSAPVATPAPSPNPPSDVSAAPSPAPSDAPAESSPAPAEAKQSLLDAVLHALPDEATRKDPDVIPAAGESATPPTQPETQEKTPPAEASDEPLPPLTKEELDAQHPRTRKRMMQLLDENQTLKHAAQEMHAEASVTHGLRQFLTESGIDKPQFEVTLDLAAALSRSDFRTFLEGIRPYVDLAEQALGMQVPPDLRQEVERGQMTSEAAARMGQERIRRQLAEDRAQAAHVRQERTVQTQNAEHLRSNIQNAVLVWEQQAAKQDPDFGLKQRAAKDVVWAVMRERGAPRSPEEAVIIAREAYDRAGQILSSTRPPPKATQPVPTSAQRANGAAASPPKTLMEAALQGLERSRAHG